MPNMLRQWWRLGGLSGLVFVVLFVVGVAIQHGVVAYDEPVEDIREFWVDSGQRYLIGDYVLGLTFTVFYIPFFIALTSLLRRAEGGEGIASRVAFVGALGALLWSASASVFWGALGAGDFAASASDETLVTLMTLDHYATAGQPFTFAVFIGAASYVVFRTRVLWRWLSYVGLAIAVASLLAPITILTGGTEDIWELFYTIAFLGFALWILLAAIAMTARRGPPSVETDAVP
jgi:hypothetical protein